MILKMHLVFHYHRYLFIHINCDTCCFSNFGDLGVVPNKGSFCTFRCWYYIFKFLWLKTMGYRWENILVKKQVKNSYTSFFIAKIPSNHPLISPWSGIFVFRVSLLFLIFIYTVSVEHISSLIHPFSIRKILLILWLVRYSLFCNPRLCTAKYDRIVDERFIITK